MPKSDQTIVSTPRAFDQPLIDLNGKIVLVTGGTGSFGRSFVRMVLERYRPEKLIVFSRDELKQHDMQQDETLRTHECLRFFIGDVRDVTRLELAMRDVDYIVHAAALKQISAAEYNPFECIRTNVHGAENIVTAAIRTGVKRVISLSTDKAVSPINLYGASKLASDKIFVAANNLAGKNGPRFAVVRYGNVSGSRGSVIPLFRKLIRDGANSLPITDPRMTRFWITLDQAVNFVLSSLEMMNGREIFVPKIPSMKIVDLARAFGPDLEHRHIGIRAGEKLHEVLITEDDARTTFEFEDRYVIAPGFIHWAEQWFEDGVPRVPENLRYTSDGNTEWLDASALGRMLNGELA